MSIEDLIRREADKGRLTHLSLIPSPRKGGKIEWRASRSASDGSQTFGESEDPVEALRACFATPKRVKPDDDDFG